MTQNDIWFKNEGAKNKNLTRSKFTISSLMGYNEIAETEEEYNRLAEPQNAVRPELSVTWDIESSLELEADLRGRENLMQNERKDTWNNNV